jgi:hypothetical protein
LYTAEPRRLNGRIGDMQKNSSALLPAAISLPVVFALALALRYPVADFPLVRDEGEYAYIAQRWLAGEVPYKHSFDQKPPGAFAAYALFIATLGESPAALHWGAQLYSLGTLAVVFALGRKLFAARVGAVAAALCAFMAADPQVAGNVANTETFMVLPLTSGALTAWLTVERGSPGWAFATGLLAAAALLCKQTALYGVVLLFAWVVWQSPRRRLLAAPLLAGLALPLLLAVAAFAGAGALPEFYDCTIGYNLSYAARVPLSEYPAAFGQAFGRLLGPFWPVYLAAAAFSLLALIRLAAPRRPRPSPAAFVLLWLGATCLAASTGGQFFPHYFVTTLPPLSLLAAAGLVAAADRLRPAWLRAAAPFLAAAAMIAYGVSLSPWYYFTPGEAGKCRYLYGDQNPFAECVPLSEYVAAITQPDDAVFVAGSEPEVYYYARRRCAGYYIFIYPLLTPFPGVRERQRAALDELRQARPAVIVTALTPASLRPFPDTPPDYLAGVDQLLDESYEVAAVLPFNGAFHGPLLTGDEAVRYYREHPTRFGTMPSDVWRRRASMVVWRRVGEAR